MQNDLSHLIGGPRLDDVFVGRDNAHPHNEPTSSVINLNRRTSSINRSLEIAFLIHRHFAYSICCFISKHSPAAALDESVAAYDKANSRAVDLCNLLSEAAHLFAIVAESFDLLLLLND